MISIDDFSKVEVRVGLVLEAENVEGSNKLIKLVVDIGPTSPEATKDLRIIFTGVRGYGYTPEDFANKKFLFVTNLEYRKMMGEESQGMILAVDYEDKPVFV